jgi:DNA-binding NarL/FixJ family response regulator
VLERFVEEMMVGRDAIAESLRHLISSREHEVTLCISEGLFKNRTARKMEATECAIKTYFGHFFQKIR